MCEICAATNPADLFPPDRYLPPVLDSTPPLQGMAMPNVSNQGDSVIKVKSLPYDACQLDVLQFFDGFRIRPNGVQLVIQGNNKPSGEV